MEISTIGLDLAKSVSAFTVLMRRARSWSGKALRRRQVLPFFASCRRAWSASRRAGRRITGRAS